MYENMPTIANKNGFRFFFYSNEGSEPPHVHVQGHGGEAKVWLQTCEITFSRNLSPAHLGWLKAHMKQNVLIYLEKWNEVFNTR